MFAYLMEQNGVVKMNMRLCKTWMVTGMMIMTGFPEASELLSLQIWIPEMVLREDMLQEERAAMEELFLNTILILTVGEK